MSENNFIFKPHTGGGGQNSPSIHVALWKYYLKKKYYRRYASEGHCYLKLYSKLDRPKMHTHTNFIIPTSNTIGDARY